MALIDKQPLDQKDGEGGQDKEEEEKAGKQQSDYPVEQDDFVLDILNKFLIGTESSFLDSINIILMLKTMPSKIVDFNLD